MNEAQRKVLKSNHGDIIKNLLLDMDILGSLLQKDVLTDTMVQTIQAKSTQHEKIMELLLMLPRRGPKAFPIFLDVVKKNSQFLSDKLQQDYEREYKIMKEQEQVAEAAHAAALSGNKHRTTLENDPHDSMDQQEHHPNKDPHTASPERTHPRSAVRAQNESPRRMSVSTTNHVMTSSIIQQNLNNLYTKLKTRIQSAKHGEPSFSSPEPATFKMVDKLLEELFQLVEEHEMTFSQCHALLGGKDRNYPLVSHIINIQKAKRELEQDVKAKEQQKNKYADHISKLENRCRNQTTEINHLNEEVKKLKEEIEKLQQINSEREEKQKIIDELRKMVMDADTTKKSKLRSSYLALHYDGNVSEIKQLRAEVRNLKMENQSLKTENLMLKKSENLKKLQKLREDFNPKVENSQGNVSNPNNDEKNNNQRPKTRHVYAQSLQNIQAQSTKGGNSKWTDSTDKANYLFHQSVEKFQKGSNEHLAVTDTDDKSKLTKSKEKDPQDLDFRFSNSHNGLYGQKRSPSKERSNKRVTFSNDETGATDSKDDVVVIPTGQVSVDNENDEGASSKTYTSNSNNQRIVKSDKTNTRGRPPRQNHAKNRSTNRRSASLNNLQGSRDLVKMSSQLIQKSRTLRTQNEYIMKMDAAAKEVLKIQKTKIKENLLFSDKMLDHLEEKDTLTEENTQEIKAEKTHEQRIDKLLYYIKRRGEGAFDNFIAAIRIDPVYETLATDLEAEYAKEHAKLSAKPEIDDQTIVKTEVRKDVNENLLMPTLPSTDLQSQHSLNILYTRLKEHMTSLQMRELSFSSPQPITFQIVIDLQDEYMKSIDECYEILGKKDKTKSLRSHIVDVKAKEKQLIDEIKEREVQRNRQSHNYIKMENAYRETKSDLQKEIQKNQKLAENVDSWRDKAGKLEELIEENTKLKEKLDSISNNNPAVVVENKESPSRFNQDIQSKQRNTYPIHNNRKYSTQQSQTKPNCTKEQEKYQNNMDLERVYKCNPHVKFDQSLQNAHDKDASSLSGLRIGNRGVDSNPKSSSKGSPRYVPRHKGPKRKRKESWSCLQNNALF